MAASFNENGYDRRTSKHIRDNVHGTICLDQFFLQFVDTEQFQRLRDLKQLGLTDMVYPGAVHSRFEHSLGVYWLADKAINLINSFQGSELGIERFDIKTVKLAGLLHDIGHGPFSHLFERGFLPQVLKGSKWCHEEMSLKIIDYMVGQHHIDIDPEVLTIVKEMIVASNKGSQKSMTGKHFLYDIVANGRNGIDVDKFDYIVRDSRACGLGCNFQPERLMDTMRVIGDEICYPAKDYLTIHKLFTSRADLHRTVYTHAKVKAIELMVVDVLCKANDYLDISSKIQEPAEYWKLDDSILKSIEISHNQELKEARDLIRRIRRRDLYKFCNQFSVPWEKLDHFKDITSQDIVCSQKSGAVTLKEEDVVVTNVKIDLTRGRISPLESINFFKMTTFNLVKTSGLWSNQIVNLNPLWYYSRKDYESEETLHIKDSGVSHLLPSFYQDTIVRVYSKKPELVEAVSEAFENFQVKEYGRKLQIHATPSPRKKSCRTLSYN